MGYLVILLIHLLILPIHLFIFLIHLLILLIQLLILLIIELFGDVFVLSCCTFDINITCSFSNITNSWNQ